MVLSVGLTKSRGASVGQGEVPPAVWQAWIDEGIIENVPPTPPAPLEPKKETKDAPKPHSGASLSKDGDPQLQDLSDDELRAMGKRLKIKSSWVMKRETLIKAIEAQT
jgi:hypothetical protein